jgi:hypothetical protein
MRHSRPWNKKGVDTIIAALLMVLIVIVMSVVVYSWATGFFGAVLPVPPNGRENLIVEYQGFDSTSKNMTLYLRNIGSAQTTLVSYYVSDLNGNQYAKTPWTGPSIAPTTLGHAYIAINPACGCKLTGSPFTFYPGNSYIVTIVTARSTQFQFTILR